MAVENRYTVLEKPWEVAIVSVEERDVFSMGGGDAAVPRSRLSEVDVRSDVPHLRRGVALDDTRSVIGRAVVVDDQLAVREVLLKNAVDSLGEIPSCVECRDTDADLYSVVAIKGEGWGVHGRS
jgi:hypothetical protein